MSRRAAQKAFFTPLPSLWPKDILRPDVNFPSFLSSRLESDFNPSSTGPEPFRPKIEDGLPPAIMVYKDHPPSDPEKQWGVLRGLVNNRYQKKYPVKSLAEPGFDPEYYNRLIAELDQAPKRNWLTAYLNSWKGFIRWEH
ncbi:hypothetical protein TWF569_003618 [Orbilia oligospora]|uniref:Uncharacterized protein n=1 Tax=Orbilia oligospora TaxID=2813651 RepID=A0A7C8NDU4_ORBOL|nr:hypothetical protein TWF103_005475 [Orbilia oligospora]KAF3110692.1 hypothetical protein TWF102_008256 [Orbilia oligospora]KAF3114453.1 hypothetical protein TWF706_008371 [Orbilia oligospora]KAF3119702.1 hypothetical protein TWF569_003618 [Orbilia oligospora]KAF3132278.1 hypothetical protein TWF703_007397 [Orbilia oligospora]